MRVGRRQALAGASLGWVVAGCGDDEPGSATDPAEAPSGRSSPSERVTRSPGRDRTTAAPSGIARTQDVPVGGGIVLPEQQVVLTQPARGDVRCFTAVCTHQGCLVDAVTDTINCPCHGSRFSIADGSVVDGPASSALAPREIVVDGDAIDLA